MVLEVPNMWAARQPGYTASGATRSDLERNHGPRVGRQAVAVVTRPLIGEPRAGFYSCRLVRGGFRVGVRIWFGQPFIDGEVQDRSPRWCCEVDGRTDRLDYDDEGNELGRVPLDPILDDVWTHCCGSPISEREFRFLSRRRDWAHDNDPQHPAANPRTPINVRKLSPGW